VSLGWVGSLRQQVWQRTGQLHLEIDQRKRMEVQMDKTHKELLVASRQAGMAEVATSVLHNVGNVLNSVNVSSTLVADNLKKSRVSNLQGLSH
jgi:phosphoglycerate-specific signal transduction histidine kinase